MTDKHLYVTFVVLAKCDAFDNPHHIFVPEYRDQNPVWHALQQIPGVLDVKVRSLASHPTAITSFKDYRGR